MRNNLNKNIIAGLLLICLFSIVWGQTEPPVSDQQKQQDQMLQEIQRLQQISDKQKQIMGVTQPPPSPPISNQRNDTVETQSVHTYLHPLTNAPSFEYPFPEQQVRRLPPYDKIHQEAYSSAVQQAIPMTPGQIHRLKQIYETAQFAAAAPAGIPPKPTATSLFINLSPGATPPVIRLGQGFVTSLVFLDSSGSPWPIAAYDNGNPSAFNIAWDMKDNILMIQAKTLYTYGNLAIRLRSLNTPIMLTLIPGQSVVDYRVDAHVPGYGPDAAQLPIQTGLPPQATPILLNIVDGIPPDGSRTLIIPEDIGQAWIYQGKLYLRTQDTLLSPGWLATMSSADGTKAYELQVTPMLLVSKNGKVIHVKIGGL